MFYGSTRDLTHSFGIWPAGVASEVETKVSCDRVSISRFFYFNLFQVALSNLVYFCFERRKYGLFITNNTSNIVQHKFVGCCLSCSFLSMIFWTTAVPRLCLDGNANCSSIIVYVESTISFSLALSQECPVEPAQGYCCRVESYLRLHCLSFLHFCHGLLEFSKQLHDVCGIQRRLDQEGSDNVLYQRKWRQWVPIWLRASSCDEKQQAEGYHWLQGTPSRREWWRCPHDLSTTSECTAVLSI